MTDPKDALTHGKVYTSHLLKALVAAFEQQCEGEPSKHFIYNPAVKEAVFKGGRFDLEHVIDKIVSASDNRLEALVANTAETPDIYRLYSVVLVYARETQAKDRTVDETRLFNIMALARNPDEALGSAIRTSESESQSEHVDGSWSLNSKMVLAISRRLMAQDLAHALDASAGGA